MPLRANNTTNYHRKTYAGRLEILKLLKRNDDLQEGTVVALVVYACWRSPITRTKEPIAGEVTADHRCDWNIALSELQRVGVDHLNSMDRIVQVAPQNLRELGAVWQPESDTDIKEAVFGNTLKISCNRVIR